MKKKAKNEKRHWRHKRVRAKISGTKKIPRFCVFRSANHIYAQLIDDEKGKTIASVDDLELKKTKTKISAKTKAVGKELSSKAAVAFEVGKLFAQKALAEKIEKVVFDRGGYQYHGRVKAIADGAREGGLKF